jgi:DNA topoisomerase I
MNKSAARKIPMTSIERLRASGILRLGTPERGFRYKRADGKKPSAQDLLRIEQLKIPPAWREVAINSAASGRLQAVGRDAAGRWQYLYHENHVKKQDQRKFKRLIEFAESLPAMRRTVAQDLRRRGLSRERVLACILRILSISFIRPGSQVYANENGSYGIATLRPKHVSAKSDLVIFDFPGKRGILQHREIRDRQVANVIRALLKHRTREVFQYEEDDGKLINIKRRHINSYVKEVMGQAFSAKDFRTWAGTLICACTLARAVTNADSRKTGKNRAVLAAIHETAEALGNTPAVCRDAYICPYVISCFEKGKIIDCSSQTIEKLFAYRGTRWHPAERALLSLLKRQSKII